MNTGIFGEGFPYSNFHDLNMDWIIKIAKDFLDQYTHIQEIIEQGKTDIQDLTTSGLEQLQEKADNLEELLQAWYNEHSEDIANQLADALEDLNDWYNTHSEDIANQLASALENLNDWYTQHENYLDQTLAENITEFNNAADEKAADTIASIPADYTTLANSVTALNKYIGFINLITGVEYSYKYFNYPISAGDKIVIQNVGNSGNIAFHTRSSASDSESAIVETISASLAPGALVIFTASQNANYISAYSPVTGVPFELGFCSIKEAIEDIEKSITIKEITSFEVTTAYDYQFFEYELKEGQKYTIKNTSDSARGGVYANTTQSSTGITTLIGSIEAGESFNFIASADANYIATYFTDTGSIEITTVNESISEIVVNMEKEQVIENVVSFVIPSYMTYNYIFYKYPFKSGRKYTIKNTSPSGNIGFWTASKNAEENRLQTISNSLPPNESIEFVSVFNADYLCYYTGYGTSFEVIGESENLKSSVVAELNEITIPELQLLPFVNRHEKYLSKIMFAGDSLIANEIGGYIPPQLDEGVSKRPIRMNYNTVARRVYDRISWNKPVWRRLDNTDWTNSGFSSYEFGEGYFDGDNLSEKYYHATTSGAYVQITVPRGFEHFALICRTKSGNGKIDVTLNNGPVGSYLNPDYLNKVSENTIVTTDIVPQYVNRGESQIDTGFSNGAGNALAVYTYFNLPSNQDNTLRFTTHDNTEVQIWGGFYWSGNTCVILNVAHGGHTLDDLKEHYVDELFPINSDLIVFEVPEMNNLRETLQKTEEDLEYYFTQLTNKYVVYTSCNPLGLSIKYDTNFYTSYLNPSQLQVNDKVKEVMLENDERFIDIFSYYERIIKSRGGTLMGGQGGLWYTWDGQHGNEAGVQMWTNYLLSNLIKMID